MDIVVITGLIISLVLTVYPVLIYPAHIRRKARNRKLLRNAGLPAVTVIVPVYNEEQHIRAKIENLRESSYPADKMKVLVVDNGSTDRTSEIAQSMGVEVLSSRRGKVFAINEALVNADSDIIVITDADIRMDREAVKILVQSLGEDIVAASARINIEDGNLFYYKSKRRYHDNDWDLRYYESLIDSCCSNDGRIMAFDRRIIDRYPEEALVDDYELTFLIKQKGGRAILNPDAVGWESSPVNLRGELEQIARRAAIGIITAWRYRSMLFRGQYGTFGILIFPVRRFFIFFIPFFLLYVAFAATWLWGISGVAVLGAVGVAMLAAGQSYPFIQFIGILKGCWELGIGRVRKGGIWERYTKKR